MSGDRRACTVVPMTEGHWTWVERIYRAGIATGHATFEPAPPTWEHFSDTRPAAHRMVAEDQQARVIGWVAAAPVSDRAAYAGVVEHAVYVDPAARGARIGRMLLDALVASTDAAGIWTIQAGIFPENVASLALHASAGFRVVGRRERIGRMTYGPLAGSWRDVVLVERRSPNVT